MESRTITPELVAEELRQRLVEDGVPVTLDTIRRWASGLSDKLLAPKGFVRNESEAAYFSCDGIIAGAYWDDACYEACKKALERQEPAP